ITVGAVDQMQTADPLDDTVPYWSAYGHTMDGFGKPDVVAPGRFLIAPVPMGSTLQTTVPNRVVAPGYMWMSGTSFSAPIVSGAGTAPPGTRRAGTAPRGTRRAGTAPSVRPWRASLP